MRQPVAISSIPWVFAFAFGALVHLAVVEAIRAPGATPTEIHVEVPRPGPEPETDCPVITVDHEWERSGAPPRALFAVRQLDDTHFRLGREALDGLLSDAHFQYARIVPSVEDGRVIGFKLFGVRRSSPLGVLGFRNGDLVTAVNGHRLDSVDSAVEAYSRLRPVEEIEVEVERSGERVVLHYEIIE